MAETIQGIQDSGVIACAKHYIGNEQEHYRQAVGGETKFAYSANIDDKTMHELYLWYEHSPKPALRRRLFETH
jgi:beta-glucosidase